MMALDWHICAHQIVSRTIFAHRPPFVSCWMAATPSYLRNFPPSQSPPRAVFRWRIHYWHFACGPLWLPLRPHCRMPLSWISSEPDEGKKIRYVIIDLHGGNAESIVKPEHVLYLPGAIEFGGIPGIAALNGTQKLTIAGMKTTPAAEIQVLEKAYEISGNSNALKLVSEPLSDELLIDLLIRK